MTVEERDMSRSGDGHSNIALIGLGVMGQDLALNIERNGFSISVYERIGKILDDFMAAHPGKQIFGFHSPELFVRSLERTRKIILLVKEGDQVDWHFWGRKRRIVGTKSDARGRA